MSDYFVHPTAIVETQHIGEGTRIWAYVHILPGAVIGHDCNICDQVFIENDVIIGDRVTIKSGVQLWDSITIEDDVFIGPNATFTNDPFPRSKQFLQDYPRTIIHREASIGANATLLPGIEIGRSAMVGAGAVVTRKVPPYAIVVGNPARINGYVSQRSNLLEKTESAIDSEEKINIPIKGVRLIKLPLIYDLRGNLSFAQYEDHLPFIPKRYFIIFDVSSKEIRGEHAHRTLHQFLVCVKGSCAVVVDDGQNRTEILLDQPNFGLYIPPMIWATQYKYTPDSILLALASNIYQPDDYIRDYEEFLSALS